MNLLLALVAVVHLVLVIYGLHLFGNAIGSAALGKDLYRQIRHDPKGKKRAAKRQKQMLSHFSDWESATVGSYFMPSGWSDSTPDSLAGLRGSSFIREDGAPEWRRNRGIEILGTLNFHVHNRDVRVVDFQFKGLQDACLSMQTLVAIEAPEIEAPRFCLRRRGLGAIAEKMMRFYEEIYSFQLLNFIIESDDRIDKVCELFHTDDECFNDRLTDMVSEQNWSVLEWSGSHLIMFRFEQCLEPGEMESTAVAAIQLAELLGEVARTMPSERQKTLIENVKLLVR